MSETKIRRAIKKIQEIQGPPKGDLVSVAEYIKDKDSIIRVTTTKE